MSDLESRHHEPGDAAHSITVMYPPPSLQTPLLEHATTQDETLVPIINVADAERALIDSNTGSASLLLASVLLCKTIVGAGSAALPFAFAKLGLACSITFLLLMAWLTHFSISSMAAGTVATGERSYPGLTERLLGKNSSLILQLSLALRCAGLMIVYIVLLTDILSGSERLPGVLCDAFGSSSWCQQREIIALILTIVVLIPITLPRKLASSAFTSYLGLTAVLLWFAATIWLAVESCLHHEHHHGLPWLPSFEGGRAEVITQVLGTIPVLATAFTCQMTVHFIMKDLKGFNQRRMDTVSAGATTVCTIIFMGVSIGSILAFGKRVPSDILKAFSTEALEKIITRKLGFIIGLAVRLGFFLSILANFPMQMLPYRESLGRIMMGHDFSQRLTRIVTVVSMLLFYVVAMLSPNIYLPLQLVGATAGAVIAFFFPALIALKCARDRRLAWSFAHKLHWQLGAYLLLVLGVVQQITGIAAVLLKTKGG